MTMVTNLYTKAFNLVIALALTLMVQTTALAAGGAHWNQNTQGAPSNSPYLTVGNDVSLDQNRPLTSSTSSFLKFTDYGAKMNYQLEFDTAPLPILRGGTGAASQQAALNALMNLSGVATGDIIVFNGTNWSLKHKGANGTFWGVSGGVADYYTPAGSGTVQSVGMTVPSWLTVTGSPITTTGTLAVTPTTGQTANQVLATPDGTTGTVGLRSLAAGDIPNISAAKITSGNLAKAQHATTAVFNDQANTYTGTFTQNFGASTQTLVIPVKASGTTTGEIALNSTDLEFRSAGVTNKAAKQAITISTTSPLSGGGDLSANRTLTLGTVDTSKGGLGLTSYTAGDMVYYSTGTTFTKVGIGGANTYWKSNGTSPSWAAAPSAFGGDGSDGAVTKGAVTETTILQINAITFDQTVSTTWAPLSGTVVNSNSTQTYSGTTTVGTGCAGGAGGLASDENGTNGAGPGCGLAAASSATGQGGSGGGNAGAGGRAGGNNAASRPGGGRTYPMTKLGGSGGGGGSHDGSLTIAGGNAGAGGGSLTSCAVGAISITGTINTNGANGSAGSSSGAGGGGGGAGGTQYYGSAASVSNSGTLNSKGGNGGSGGTAEAGGGGGGGYIFFHSPSNTNGTRTVTGGTAGTTVTAAAAAGSSGSAISITGTPNLPLLISMQEDNFAKMKSVALAKRVLNFPAREGFDVEISQREAAVAASGGNVIQFAKLVDGSMEASTCIEIGDHVEALDNAA